MIGRPIHRFAILLSCCIVAYIILVPNHRISPNLVALNLLFLGLLAWLLFEASMRIRDHLHNHEAWEKVKSEPSKWGEIFILLFAPSKDAEGLMGDLEEIFNREFAHGMSRGRVRFRYWGRLLRSVGPALLTKLKNYGLLGLILAWLRR
jgi:hypothetical protein